MVRRCECRLVPGRFLPALPGCAPGPELSLPGGQRGISAPLAAVAVELAEALGSNAQEVSGFWPRNPEVRLLRKPSRGRLPPRIPGANRPRGQQPFRLRPARRPGFASLPRPRPVRALVQP